MHTTRCENIRYNSQLPSLLAETTGNAVTRERVTTKFMTEGRRPSYAALVGSARSTAAAGLRRGSSQLQRMGLRKRTTAGEAKAAIAGPFEHYKFDGEESSMHLEWRARQGKGHQRMVRIVQECLVWLLGVGLGLLVGSMTIAARVSPPPYLRHPASTLPPPRPRDPHRPALICPRLPSRALTSYVSLTSPHIYPHLP
jgi:hypothetical protein